MKVGVLALQGDYREHLRRLHVLGASATAVKTQSEIDDVDALVLPGGESTTIGFLLVEHDLIEPLRARIQGGMPVYGTCAGLILLANSVIGPDVPRLRVLDAVVHRNAYGRQTDSFEAPVDCGALGVVHAVFIRAPIIESTGEPVEVIGFHDGRPVLVRQANVLAGSFHPELTGEDRIHRYFIEEVCCQ